MYRMQVSFAELSGTNAPRTIVSCPPQAVPASVAERRLAPAGSGGDFRLGPCLKNSCPQCPVVSMGRRNTLS